MRITVINGTEKQGVTYNLKEIFLEPFKDSAEITEFYLPRDCPNFCAGCTVCFRKDPNLCKDAQYVQKIEKALREADLLVFTSPAYVYHATGAMKAMLDHFGYTEWGKKVLDAIEEVMVEKKFLTPDMGGTAKTHEVGAAVIAKLK